MTLTGTLCRKVVITQIWWKSREHTAIHATVNNALWYGGEKKKRKKKNKISHQSCNAVDHFLTLSPPSASLLHITEKGYSKGKNNHISHSSFADTHNAQLVKSLHQPFYNICIHKSVGKTVNSLYSRIYYFPSYLNASIWIRGSRHQQHNVKKKKSTHA